ncbi:Rab subfamily of small GTPases [Rhizoctonia solani]|uniref:Rab subfamily of small GTPases n=1 Tax=Rhizoctonia solani TaxID=456999 RepID=A0A8H7I0T2_9AGAM|nr:Rab subfamily of small GTPases [Rhizoctonia solani]
MAEPYDEAAATEMVEAYDFLLKFIVIGEAGSGKSCLLHQFTQNSFKEHSQHTIGVEFSSRTINIGEKRVNSNYGTRLVRSGFVHRSSFLNLSRWLADARALGSSQLVTVLVGNKTDREEEREVEWSEASKWASENDVHFIETSSLTGDNIEKPFALAARAILLSIEGGQLDPEKAGSGVSYGDRQLRRIASGSRLSFSMGSVSSGRGYLIHAHLSLRSRTLNIIITFAFLPPTSGIETARSLIVHPTFSTATLEDFLET